MLATSVIRNMKMNTQKAILLLMASLMAFTLVACDDSGKTPQAMRPDNSKDTPQEQQISATTVTAEELKNIFTAYDGNHVVTIDDNYRLAEGEVWNPITFDTTSSAITVNGNGHTILGLNAPLYDSKNSASPINLTINDLTLADVTIESTENKTQGLGAFISNVYGGPKFALNGCILRDSSITATTDQRVGGLIGLTCGPDDGTTGEVTVTNCRVENCKISAHGSVGAIIGHAGENKYAIATIDSCTITGNTLKAIKDGWRVGVVVGTANIGDLTISNITESGNTLEQYENKIWVEPVSTNDSKRNYYGRFVSNDIGKLTIDGKAIPR